MVIAHDHHRNRDDGRRHGHDLGRPRVLDALPAHPPAPAGRPGCRRRPRGWHPDLLTAGRGGPSPVVAMDRPPRRPLRWWVSPRHATTSTPRSPMSSLAAPVLADLVPGARARDEVS